ASWATPAARAGMVARFTAARAAFDAAPGGPYRFDVAVLAVRTQLAAGGQVTVDAWCAEAVFARGGLSYGTYVTQLRGLVRRGGLWLLPSLSDTAGPSVATAGPPTPAAEAAAALAGFTPPPPGIGPSGGGHGRS